MDGYVYLYGVIKDTKIAFHVGYNIKTFGHVLNKPRHILLSSWACKHPTWTLKGVNKVFKKMFPSALGMDYYEGDPADMEDVIAMIVDNVNNIIFERPDIERDELIGEILKLYETGYFS